MQLLAFAIAATFLMGATCVSNVKQHSPTGPWAGEVVNTGGQTVYGVAALAQVKDANGREYYPGRVSVLACPSKLLPGERGAFELFLPTDNQNPDFTLADPALPLSATFDTLAGENVGTGQARGDGLLVEELSRDTAAASVRVRLTNNGPGAYSEFTVCGVMRDLDGALVEVGRVDGPPLPSQLAPGASMDLTIHFNSMPAGSLDIRYHALGLLNAPYAACCPLGASSWYAVDLRWFSLLLPPAWRYEAAQGIDSFVGSFVGPDGMRLTFDYGAFSDSLPYDADPTYRVHRETIGGRTAKIVASTAASGVTGAHFATIQHGQFSSSALTISGANLSPAQQDVALQVFRSIRMCRCVVR